MLRAFIIRGVDTRRELMLSTREEESENLGLITSTL